MLRAAIDTSFGLGWGSIEWYNDNPTPNNGSPRCLRELDRARSVSDADAFDDSHRNIGDVPLVYLAPSRYCPVSTAEASEQRVDSSSSSVLADVVGAVALVIYSVTASAAFAALVFTGPAADGVPRGVATFLLA
ncbi:MAG: hypothetical protein ACJAR2_001807 [Ilumatobacter sp.]|jgi:hypothetical protein